MSNKKFFTLIHGDSIHIAPKKKVIPAEEFSALLTAVEVIDHVKTDAEKYKIEVAAECEKIKEQAYRDGYEIGFQEWANAVAALEQEIEKVRRDMERMLIPVALKAAKKIVGREIELSEDAIVDIVMNSLKAVAQHKKITIYVNRKDLDLIERNRPKIKIIFESLEALSIRERADVLQGGCVIETEGGIINAQLENQWNALEKAFSSLLTKRKEVASKEAESVPAPFQPPSQEETP